MIGDGPTLDRFVFRLSVKPFGKLKRLEIAADLLQIDPDILSVRNCYKHSALRMRQVEAQDMRIALLIQQGRFARRPWLDPEHCRLDAQIPSKNNAKAPVRQCKPNLIFRTNESSRASALLFAETGMTVFEYRRIGFEGGAPKIHGTVLQGNAIRASARKLVRRRKGQDRFTRRGHCRDSEWIRWSSGYGSDTRRGKKTN